MEHKKKSTNNLWQEVKKKGLRESRSARKMDYSIGIKKKK